MKSKIIGIIGGSIALIASVFAWLITNISGFGTPSYHFLNLFAQNFWPWLGAIAFLALIGIVLSLAAKKIVWRVALILIGFFLIGLSIYQYFAVPHFWDLYAAKGADAYGISYQQGLMWVYFYALAGSFIGGALLTMSGFLKLKEK